MTTQTMGGIFTHPKQVSPSGYLEDPERAIKEDTLATSLHDPSYEDTREGGNSGNQRGNPDNHDWNKRYSNLKSYADKTINDKNSTIADLQAQLEKAKRQVNIQFPKTDEELAVWKEQYSDLYDVMRTLVLKESTTLSSEFKADIASLQKQREEAKKEAAKEKVLAKHPDAFELIDDEDFIAWFHTQSSGVQQLINSTDASDIIRGFDLYKMETGRPEPKSTNTDAAKSVKTGKQSKSPSSKGKTWTESEVMKLTDREFRALEKEIEQAANEGRLIYDISQKR